MIQYNKFNLAGNRELRENTWNKSSFLMQEQKQWDSYLREINRNK